MTHYNSGSKVTCCEVDGRCSYPGRNIWIILFAITSVMVWGQSNLLSSYIQGVLPPSEAARTCRVLETLYTFTATVHDTVFVSSFILISTHTVTYMGDCRQGLDWRMNLLTTYIHYP
jgi:hypothetical protein